MSVPPFNPYEVLGLSKSATQDDVRKAYKRLALQCHPDKNNGDDIKFKQINEAYQILSDPLKKQLYDEHLTDENVDWSFVAKFASELMNVIKERMQQKMQERAAAKEKEAAEEKEKEGASVKKDQPNKVKSIFVKMQVDIQDIYNASVKKLVVRVKRKEGNEMVFKSIPVYISLLDYEQVYIFEQEGDDGIEEGVPRGDIIVKLDIISQAVPSVSIDNIISKYDLHIEKEMTLYEYYYGINTQFSYFNGEVINIKHITTRKDKEQHTYYNFVHEVKGKGLPYSEETSEGKYTDKRGDLIVFFKLTLPGLDTNVLDNHKNFFEAYFNGQSQETK